jgi:hypothetical protein
VPQRHPQPGHQLAHTERFCQVVVGTGLQRGDLVALPVAHRQHDDWDARPLPDLAREGQAIPVRETEVENDHVGALRGDLLERLCSGRRLDHPVPLAREAHPQEAPNRRLVVDHEDERFRGYHSRCTLS